MIDLGLAARDIFERVLALPCQSDRDLAIGVIRHGLAGVLVYSAGIAKSICPGPCACGTTIANTLLLESRQLPKP
jgi:hypothetical protein